MAYDTYIDKSLKGMTREKRGTGARGKVTSSSQTPTNWTGFLRVNKNKSEFFRFLLEEIFNLRDGNIISAFDSTVTSQPAENVVLMSPTHHDEADTRLFLHVNAMATKGLTWVMIRTVDTDVCLFSISLYNSLNLEQLWIDFGSGELC